MVLTANLVNVFFYGNSKMQKVKKGMFTGKNMLIGYDQNSFFSSS